MDKRKYRQFFDTAKKDGITHFDQHQEPVATCVCSLQQLIQTPNPEHPKAFSEKHKRAGCPEAVGPAH
jgi:hypothetical protein